MVAVGPFSNDFASTLSWPGTDPQSLHPCPWARMLDRDRVLVEKTDSGCARVRPSTRAEPHTVHLSTPVQSRGHCL